MPADNNQNHTVIPNEVRDLVDGGNVLPSREGTDFGAFSAEIRSGFAWFQGPSIIQSTNPSKPNQPFHYPPPRGLFVGFAYPTAPNSSRCSSFCRGLFTEHPSGVGLSKDNRCETPLPRRFGIEKSTQLVLFCCSIGSGPRSGSLRSEIAPT